MVWEDEDGTHLRSENGLYGWYSTIKNEHSSQWAAISSIAAKFDCTTETLRRWVREAELDQGRRAGITSDE